MEENINVVMTPEQMREFKEFQAKKEQELAAERLKQERQVYLSMVDEQVRIAIADLESVSGRLKTAKEKILTDFENILEMKRDVIGKTKDGQKSHTFMTSDGLMKLTIGRHTCDSWRDTVNDGIHIVREACLGMIKDATTKALVNQIMRLIAKDSAGNLKANKALQLRKLANELNNEEMNKGIAIIEEAYIPTLTKVYIYAEVRNNKTGDWSSIPLGITEAHNSVPFLV